MVYSFLDWAFAPLIRLKVKKVVGLENLPCQGGFILAVNHDFHNDDLYLVAALLPRLKRKIHFIVHDYVYDFCGKKLGGDLLGFIRISRDCPSACLAQARELLMSGKIIGIYPEGTTQKSGLIRGKTGAARLALWTKKPVVPVGFISKHPDIIGQKYFILLFKSFFLWPRFIINIGKPMTFEKYYGQSIDKTLLYEVTDKIMRQIAFLCQKEYKRSDK